MPGSQWAVIQVETDYTRCGGTQANIWVVKNLAGAPHGTREGVCPGLGGIPGGWSTVNTESASGVCGPQSNLVTVIQKN